MDVYASLLLVLIPQVLIFTAFYAGGPMLRRGRGETLVSDRRAQRGLYAVGALVVAWARVNIARATIDIS